MINRISLCMNCILKNTRIWSEKQLKIIKIDEGACGTDKLHILLKNAKKRRERGIIKISGKCPGNIKNVNN